MDDPGAVGSSAVASTPFVGKTTYLLGAFYLLSCINCASKATVVDYCDYHDNHALLIFKVVSQHIIVIVAVRPPNLY